MNPYGGMRLHYSRRFIKSLGVYPPIMRIGYYWVDGEYLRYWSPNWRWWAVCDDGRDGSGRLVHIIRGRRSSYLSPEDLCDRLNEETKRLCSSPSYWDRNHAYTPERCLVIRGGPHKDECFVNYHRLPVGAGDVFNFPNTIELRLHVEGTRKHKAPLSTVVGHYKGW